MKIRTIHAHGVEVSAAPIAARKFDARGRRHQFASGKRSPRYFNLSTAVWFWVEYTDEIKPCAPGCILGENALHSTCLVRDANGTCRSVWTVKEA